MSSSSVPRRSPAERLLHALTYEAVAICLCTPALAWALGRPLLQLGVLTLMFAAIAMLWNISFTWLFDHAQQRLGFRRSFGVRCVHAALFELGLVLLLVPLAAWWLGVGLWQALLLDFGLILFFLPYTLVFNWSWDVLRTRWSVPA